MLILNGNKLAAFVTANLFPENRRWEDYQCRKES